MRIAGKGRGIRLCVALALVACAPRADADEAARLRAENARLQSRVRELEAENASLRARVGTVEAAADRSVTTERDDTGAVRAVELEPSRLELTGGNRSRHWISLHAEEGAATIQIEAAASSGAYRDVAELELTLDGTPLELPVTSRTATPIFAGPRQERVGERETVSIAAPADLVARIGSAREVRGRLGPTTFVLAPEQVASFAAVARRLQAPGK